MWLWLRFVVVDAVVVLALAMVLVVAVRGEGEMKRRSRCMRDGEEAARPLVLALVLCHTKPCAKERRKRCMHHGDVAAQPLCGSWRCSGAVPLSLIPLATCVIPRSVHPLNGRRCAWRRCWRIFIGRAQGFTC